MNTISDHNQFNKYLVNTLIISILTATGVITGIVPQLSFETGELNFSRVVYAQNVTDDQLKQYAQALVEIEKLRQPTFANLEGIVGKEKASQISCNQENTISQLPDNARSIASSYCNQSEAIVKKYGLTNGQFNQITKSVNQNPSLKQKLESIIRQL
jgi:dephospho-CoA kinase